MKTVKPDFVRELIDFAPTEEQRQMGFAETQIEGTVALFNMLVRNRCAYLADEVGMGKTYVALGVMGLLRQFDPHARIVVIAPRENIQRKWHKELQNFVRLNWKVIGNRVKALQGSPAWEPVICDSLANFAREALLNADRDFFLRMTSFSLSVKEEESRKRLRRRLREAVPWLDEGALKARTPEAFRDAYGCALNAAVPNIDLLVVDEAHNFKHGFGPKVSNRNRVMGLAFGHPEGRSEERPWYRRRVKRVLLLSATPFEEDYASLQHQLSVFGFGDAALRTTESEAPVRVRDLRDPGLAEESKQEIVRRLMVRRVSGLTVGGQLLTKNMYRREWRRGGYSEHDVPIQIEDTKQRLVVALMQKKVAEVLQDERFNNHFQIGMLSSFESFRESVATAKRRRRDETEEQERSEATFEGEQEASNAERLGIDTDAIGGIVESHRRKFGAGLPHPKLDATSTALEGTFESGEKTLVFVRRVATVNELGAKLDAAFDGWIRRRMEAALPEMRPQLDRIFKLYEEERSLRPDERLERYQVDELEHDQVDHPDAADDDEGSAETFFSWFFRGKGPARYLSGAAFQKNRLSSTSSVYATLFEDDHVSWLLGFPEHPLESLGQTLGLPAEELGIRLAERAYARFRERSARKQGYPRLYVFEGYQVAALELLEQAGGELGERARVVLEERYPGLAAAGAAAVPSGFPSPEEAIGVCTIFTELARRRDIRDRVWPEEGGDDFPKSFRRREQRRELLSALARLGLSYVDLYLLAIRPMGSFSLRQEAEVSEPVGTLAREFVDLLEAQMRSGEFGAFRELSNAASEFDLIVGVNFPQVPHARLAELAAIYGATLQRQVPVGRMSGGVNKRLVRQFRMPGFPVVLVTTDVLQEGEDLHTFCRRVVHYGISWTPSAMEQRTGRIDRIGGLVQRQLDGSKTTPEAEQLIQVYYPHLRDTVEVLQVRRVLKRLNRFLRLIHRSRDGAGDRDSRIDTNRAMLEDLDDVKQIEGPLESAFPVREEWLGGELGREDFEPPDTQGLLDHFDQLFGRIAASGWLQARRSGDRRRKEGTISLVEERLAERFQLELRSQAAGDATLVRCEVEVGGYDLSTDEDLDRLDEIQRGLGLAKVCTRPDARHGVDLVAVREELLFHPLTTQVEELEGLLRRVARAASFIHHGMAGARIPEAPLAVRGLGELFARVEAIARRQKLPWKVRKDGIDVDLVRRGRRQRVTVLQRDDTVLFQAVVLDTGRDFPGDSDWRDLARLAWRRNAAKELVAFGFDEEANLVGLIQQPAATLDDEEIELYVATVAKECDRFEYALTGEDVE